MTTHASVGRLPSHVYGNRFDSLHSPGRLSGRPVGSGVVNLEEVSKEEEEESGEGSGEKCQGLYKSTSKSSRHIEMNLSISVRLLCQRESWLCYNNVKSHVIGLGVQ